MNTHKHIICINILILDYSWPILDPIPNFSLLKCPYIYIIDIFSCLFSTCTREWSKVIIKTTNYWPFMASKSWLQKFITKSKLIHEIIYKNCLLWRCRTLAIRISRCSNTFDARNNWVHLNISSRLQSSTPTLLHLLKLAIVKMWATQVGYF
jgi:hypothetical protein